MTQLRSLAALALVATLAIACVDAPSTAPQPATPAAPAVLLAKGAGGGGGGGGGGGTPGDGFAASITYTESACPIPDAIRTDYLDIYYCALGKFTSKPRDFVLRVSGHTTLAAGTVREVRATSSITLPCGIVASVGRWLESASAVISPVGSPNTLYAESDKIPDSCP